MKSWANAIVVVIVIVIVVEVRVVAINVPHVVIVVSRPKPGTLSEDQSTRSHFLVFPYISPNDIFKAFLLLSGIFSFRKFPSKRTWNANFSEISFLAHFVLRYQMLRFL